MTSGKKSQETKEKILLKALELFQKRGFEKTTMRDISKELNIALGAAYYYFSSKEEIVVEFYLQTQKEWQEKADEIINKNNDFKKVMKEILHLQFEILKPYRNFLSIILNKAIDPKSSLSPFSKKTNIIRQTNIESFQKVLLKTKISIHKDSKKNFPYLLWLMQMSIILFWLYDSSKDQTRSKSLVNNLINMLHLMLKLSSFGPAKPLQKMLNNLIKDISDINPGAVSPGKT